MIQQGEVSPWLQPAPARAERAQDGRADSGYAHAAPGAPAQSSATPSVWPSRHTVDGLSSAVDYSRLIAYTLANSKQQGAASSVGRAPPF